MIRKIRGKVAWILAVVMLNMAAFSNNAAASEEILNVGNEDVSGDVYDIDDKDVMSDDLGNEDERPIEEEQKGQVSDMQQSMEKEPDSVEEEPVFVNQGLVNYVAVEYPYLQVTGEQKLVVSYGNGMENISNAKVICNNSDGRTIEFELSERKNELYLFKYNFQEQDTGVYQIVYFSYLLDGIETYIRLDEIGIDARFEVGNYNPATSGSMERAGVSAQDIEASVVTIDMNSLENAENSIEEAIEETVEITDTEKDSSEQSGSALSRATNSVLSSVANVLMPAAISKAAGNVVVVLDPGHGGEQPGASSNGLVEKDLNLRVALACKSELEQYNGIEVYMTRESDVTVGLKERADKAKAWGADIFVSIHMNSAPSTSANGAEVYYPNSNYNSEVHEKGEALANQIQEQLASLGLYDRGSKQDPSTEPGTYPDGSRMDGYQVIKYNKLNGIPGIIVEHAFLTNSGDAEKLKDADFIRKLGVADATGIANYFNLTKGISVKIEKKNDFIGTAQINAAGLGENAKIRISNKKNQKVKDYVLASGKDIIEFSISDYDNARGEYSLEAINSSGRVIYSDSFKISEDASSEIELQQDHTEKQYKVVIKFADMPSEVKEIQVPVWHEPDQSDLKWYKAAQISKGNWQATINVSDYKVAGIYNVHIYAVLSSGISHFLGGKAFSITQPTLKMKIDNYQANNGTFDVVVTDIVSPSGINKIEVPVWCAEDQSDIKWYNAIKQQDGKTYRVTVNTSNHKYAVGVYKVHTYITAGNGIVAFGGGAAQNVMLPDMSISVTDPKATEMSYTLNISNVGRVGTVKNVQFGVWSAENGQDDLKWYDGSKNTIGDWTAVAEIKNHKTIGKYHVHVYATLSNGSIRFLGAQSFDVTNPTLSVNIKDYQAEKGTFDVILSNINSPSGVEKIQVPVWCAADQNDIKWYNAEKQNDGTYKVTVNMSNHKHAIGDYKVHTYITARNGITVFGGGSAQKVILPNMEISITDTKASEMNYTLKLSKAESLGVIKNVQFGTWSDEGGQDDLKWYSGSKNASGDWVAVAEIKNHKTAGRYQVHVYVTMANGVTRFIGAKAFDVSKPSLAIIAENYEAEKGTFDLILSNIKSPSGVSRIQVPVWCAADQSDIKWYDAKKQDGSDTYKVTVSMSNHKYAAGVYQVHTYITAGNGITAFGGGCSQKVTIPDITISAVDADVDGKEMNYILKASNTNFYGVIKNVQFATWSHQGGQDDLKWYEGSKDGAGNWRAIAEIKNHKTAGIYSVHVYATLSSGVMKFLGATTFDVKNPSISGVNIEKIDEETGILKVVIENAYAASGISKVQVAAWCRADQSDIKWYDAIKQGKEYVVNIDPMYHNYNFGLYKIHTYIRAKNGVYACVNNCTQLVEGNYLYKIMGESSVTIEQMMDYFEANGGVYPSESLKVGGAETLEQFCRIYIEEAEKEGVRAEVAFAQSMKETGWLRFGGIVQIGQFNFAGLGAEDGNTEGNCASFPDVRIGVRAQIQHLKAYASTEALTLPLVDPRFVKVKRGSAPYVEWLGQKENPDGLGWATAEGYGRSIVNMIKKMIEN